MRRRPLLVAKCKAFYLLAGTGAEQQGLRRQNALVPNAPIRRPGVVDVRGDLPAVTPIVDLSETDLNMEFILAQHDFDVRI